MESHKKMKRLLMEIRKRHKKLQSLLKANLPLCLIEANILPRLPAKSVGRCMCVCKQWNSFLSTPTFAKMHLHHRTIHDYKLLLLDAKPTRTPTFTTRDFNYCSTIIRPSASPNLEFTLASVDGLVCLGSRDLTKLLFWNPLTGTRKKLSSSSRGFQISHDHGENAFGLYNDSNDYKLLYLNMGRRPGAYIYSLILDSWREIDFSIGSNIGRNWCHATLCGQCLYFNVTYRFESHRWVVCFDVKTETFSRRRFPNAPRRAIDYSGSLVVLNGCIRLCTSYTLESTIVLKQGRWRMDGDDGWVRVPGSYGGLCYYNEFRGRGICTTSIGNWLAILDVDNSFKKMNAADFTAHHWPFFSPNWLVRSSRMIYVETLVSPNL